MRSRIGDVRKAKLLDGSAGLDERLSALRDAHRVLLAHVATVHGLCVGCLDGARLALSPCPAVRQSVSLIESHGVAAWDAVTEFGRGLR